MYTLNTYQFNSTKNYWTLVQGGINSRYTRNTLDILTYNVWFASDYFEERTNCILNLIQGADIVCLQEVTPKFLSHLKNTDWVKKDYFLARSIPGKYGIVILSKFLMTFYSAYLDSSQGRTFLFGDVTVNGKKLRIGTVHLESFQTNEQVRCDQIIQIAPFLNFDTNIFTGDFNIRGDSGRDSEVLEKKMPYFCDAWKQLHPNSPGYTYDSELNRMIGYRTSQARFDRFLYKSMAWTVTSLEMVGVEQVKLENGVLINPSDHFGLRATITWVDHILKFRFHDVCAKSGDLVAQFV